MQWAGEGTLPGGLNGLQFYSQRKMGEEKRPLSFSRCQAYIPSSSFISGRQVSDLMRSN